MRRGFTRMAVLGLALTLGNAQAETWYWYGGTKDSGTYGGKPTTAANWTNATHTLSSGGGVPAAGDSVVFEKFANKCSTSSNAFTPGWGDVLIKKAAFNQFIVCLTSGHTVTVAYDGNPFGTSGLCLYGDGETRFVPNYNQNLTFQKNFTGKNGSPTLVKDGPWTLTCFYQSGKRTYSIPYTKIRQGTINITTTTTNSSLTVFFDGNDASQCLEYTTGSYVSDLTFKDSAIIETNGVANTGHSISASSDAQLVFTGTPKVNPMVFSGTFKNKAGLTWSPGNAAYAFVCSNAVSSTSGRFVVTKGALRLVTGASFTNAAEVAVSSGARFEVSDAPGEAFKVQTLTLSDATATVGVGEGVRIAFVTATMNGVPMRPGTYAKTPAEGEREATWIDGEGRVVIETGPGNTGTWDGGDAASTLVTSAANWADDTVPDFEAGDLLAQFAAGGVAATIPAATTAKFAGLVLQNETGESTFSFAAENGGRAEIGTSGITGDKSSAATVWNLGWPLTLAGGQTWTLGANDTLNLTGGLAGTGDLTFANAGIVNFAAPGTHSGTLSLVSGKYRVTATGGLGTAREISYPHADVNLAFGNAITVSNALTGTSYITSEAAQTQALEIEAGADVSFEGKVSLPSTATLRYGSGGKAMFANGLTVPVMAVHGTLYVTGANGTLAVTNTRISCSRGMDISCTAPFLLDLSVANNRLSADEWCFCKSGTTVRTHLSGAFDSGSRIALNGASRIELAGGSHALADLASDTGSTVACQEPAVLAVSPYSKNANNLYSGTNRVNRAAFSGPLSLVKGGDYPFALGSVSTATGGLSVSQGILTLTATAGWPNCTNVTVAAGATLKVLNANAFGDADRTAQDEPVAAWQVTGTSVLDLEYEGTVRAKILRLDGKRVHGTFGAVGSGAEREVAWITGTGRLRADPVGLAIFLR